MDKKIVPKSTEANNFGDPHARYEIRQYRGDGLHYMTIDGLVFCWGGANTKKKTQGK